MYKYWFEKYTNFIFLAELIFWTRRYYPNKSSQLQFFLKFLRKEWMMRGLVALKVGYNSFLLVDDIMPIIQEFLGYIYSLKTMIIHKTKIKLNSMISMCIKLVNSLYNQQVKSDQDCQSDPFQFLDFGFSVPLVDTILVQCYAPQVSILSILQNLDGIICQAILTEINCSHLTLQTAL